MFFLKSQIMFFTGAKSFERRSAKKYYLAILRGHMDSNFVKINLGIGADSRPEFRKIKMASELSQFCQKPRPSETLVAVLSRGLYDGDPVTKVSRLLISWTEYFLENNQTYFPI